jgi:hypothetical protein
MATKELKLEILHFLNEVGTIRKISDEWRNAIVIPILKRVRKDTKFIEE